MGRAKWSSEEECWRFVAEEVRAVQEAERLCSQLGKKGPGRPKKFKNVDPQIYLENLKTPSGDDSSVEDINRMDCYEEIEDINRVLVHSRRCIPPREEKEMSSMTDSEGSMYVTPGEVLEKLKDLFKKWY